MRALGEKGFTLIELLIVIALMVILGAIGFTSLVEKNQRDEFNSTVRRIVTLLNQARDRSFTQDNFNATNVSDNWGVSFYRGPFPAPTNDLCLSKLPSGFSPSSPGFSITGSNLGNNQYFSLPATISFESSSFGRYTGDWAQGCKFTFGFRQITGALLTGTGIATSAEVRVYMTSNPDVSSTIFIYPSGLIESSGGN